MKLKKIYTSPTSKTLELNPQGLLCWSEPSGSLFLLVTGTESFTGDRDAYTVGGNPDGTTTLWN